MPPFSDISAAVRWWAVLMLLGTAALPLTYTFFRRLPDRGYAFTKMIGLLIVSYLFWLLGSLGFLENSVGGILFALAGLVGLSLWVYRRNAKELVSSDDAPDEDGSEAGQPLSLGEWLRENWRQVLITELVFTAVFALWVWVRAQNPAIMATEKPMEFAFLNSVGRTPEFPPLDPWLSGFAISYYYFGYVMVSVLARLAAVPEAIAFNLGIAWLVAGTAVSAFGLVYNLIAAKGTRRAALTLGMIAAVAIPIAGNLEIGLEVAYANGAGSDAFWRWLDVRDLNPPATPAETPRYETTSWWWWRASRPIHEYHLFGRPEEGLEPIAEFPSFSFILGDMHPHVLALPFAFVSLALAFVWYIETSDWRLEIGSVLSGGQSLISNLRSHLPFLLFTALLLGGLSFLNTWDVLIHLFVILGAFVLAQWRARGWNGRILNETILLAVLLVVVAVVLYLPFYIGFRSQAGAPYLLPMLMRPTRLVHFLIIFGMPLLPVSLLVLGLAAKQRFAYWKMGVATAVILIGGLLLLMLLLGWIIASTPDGAARVGNLAQELGIALPPRPETAPAPGWGATAVFALIPTIISARLIYPGVILLLTTIISLTIMVWKRQFATTNDASTMRQHRHPSTHPALPFALLLIATGALLTLGPEFVYLRDNFGQRLNTIFKFYYQAWVMLGVAALFAIDYLWREFIVGARRAVPAVATVGYVAALAIALLFPFYAVRSRAAEYRGPLTSDDRLPATLDGLAQLRRFNPDEYEAMMWLRQNTEGTPVIVEAVGGAYSNYGRFAAATGLPTILGWANHEYQWRGNDTPEPGERDPAVRTIYTAQDWQQTADILNHYNVSYVVIGGLERDTYTPLAQDKFANRLPVAYQNNGVTIYEWQPQ